jgi:hypothetical protein
MTIDPNAALVIVVILVFLWFSGMWKAAAAIILVCLAIVVVLYWLVHLGLSSAMYRPAKQYKLSRGDCFRVVKDYFELAQVGNSWAQVHKADSDAGILVVSLSLLGEQSKAPNLFVIQFELKTVGDEVSVEPHWEAQYHYIDGTECTEIVDKVYDDLDKELVKASQSTDVERQRIALDNEIQRYEILRKRQTEHLAELQPGSATAMATVTYTEHLKNIIETLRTHSAGLAK